MYARRRTVVMLVFALAGGGCATTTRDAPATALIPARDLVDLDAPGVYRTYDPQVAIAFLRAHRAPAAQESLRNVLALSGGGMYGAYTAGVLKGMTASGKRPTFDVVTGISTTTSSRSDTRLSAPGTSIGCGGG
jgi:hypothetical protein